MDHFPIPEGSAARQVRVPYIRFDGPPCSFGVSPLTQFPERHGYDKLLILKHGNFTMNGSKSMEESAAFLEEWLFFGLLSEFLERPVDKIDFTFTDDDDRVFVTTKNIMPLLETWSREVAGPERIARVQACLFEAQNFIA